MKETEGIIKTEFEGPLAERFRYEVEEAIRIAGPQHIRRIKVTAGPYRAYDVKWEIPNPDAPQLGEVWLDFYSASIVRGGVAIEDVVSCLEEADRTLGGLKEEHPPV